jgi:hypothetical protein
MLAEILTVIMKMLSNNRGISLVILIVVMTLIAILGASFVSLMGSKQKGFVYQIDSYRALNIANAGVEYAIRYISDGLCDTTNPSNNFFNNPNVAVTRSFAGGAFGFTYDHMNNWIMVIGNYPDPNPVSRRDVRLSNFRRYLSPVSLVPDGLSTSVPQINVNDTNIPTISNNENNFSVSRIDVTITTTSNMYMNILRDGSPIFINSGPSPYAPCLSTPAPVCYDSANGIYIGTGSGTFRFDLSSPNPNHTPDSLHTYILRFTTTPPTGQYSLEFHTSLPTGNPYAIKFILP